MVAATPASPSSIEDKKNSNMGSFKDVSRVINGVSLIAKEFFKRNSPIESARTGDFETLITAPLKKALVLATDLSGLTKGNVREYSDPGSSNSSVSSDSVVYFTDPSNVSITSNDKVGIFSSEAKNVDVGIDGSESPVKDFREASGTSIGANVCSTPESVDEARHGALGSETQSCSVETVYINRGTSGEVATTPPLRKRKPRERKVPSTPFSRALGFAGLGAGLAWGTLQESAKRLAFGRPDSQNNQSAPSPFLSEQNAERIALALCRMRGAALKIGQMLSIQDESLVPAPILAALEIVRQGADVMPKSQLNQVLNAELGPDWSSKLISFDYEPMAAASIGQVHRAVIKDGMEVAMKIQYPGVADSIESDIENVKLLLNYTNLIPKGLYLDRAIKVAKDELSRECDYELEAANQKRFQDLIAGTEGFYVPIVVDDILSKRVLTTELVSGITIDKVASLNQETRNYIGKKLLELTLMELFVFRFMQTDPNWGNFLYDEATNSINLIDFGAARDYPKNFVDDYLRMVLACANADRDGVIEMSKRLGFITGMESDVMLDAHVQAGFVVGLPFSKFGGFNFRAANITQSISHLGSTMLKHRLTPPPDEAYSLHRKLSGAFLACIKIGAVVPCRELLLQVYDQHQFGEEGNDVGSVTL